MMLHTHDETYNNKSINIEVSIMIRVQQNYGHKCVLLVIAMLYIGLPYETILRQREIKGMAPLSG